MTGQIGQQFILDSKIALEILKTRVAISTRIYSNLTESYVRGSPQYGMLLQMRKDKSVDRKETAKVVKRLLKEQLAASELSEEDFKALFEQTKKENVSFQILLDAEDEAFKKVRPQLKEVPVSVWMDGVKGLGLRFAVKLLSHIRDINRFENPSKLRKYCGTVPGQKKQTGVEAHFNPELKGILLGQVAESFIKCNSQYKRVYDEKKVHYLGLHPEALTMTYEEQVSSLVKKLGRKLRKGEAWLELWTKSRIHEFSKKTMINRFLVDLWMAWYMSEGKVPPKNPWIADQPHHSLEPMVVPFTDEMKRRTEEIRVRSVAVPHVLESKPKKDAKASSKASKASKPKAKKGTRANRETNDHEEM